MMTNISFLKKKDSSQTPIYVVVDKYEIPRDNFLLTNFDFGSIFKNQINVSKENAVSQYYGKDSTMVNFGIDLVSHGKDDSYTKNMFDYETFTKLLYAINAREIDSMRITFKQSITKTHPLLIADITDVFVLLNMDRVSIDKSINKFFDSQQRSTNVSYNMVDLYFHIREASPKSASVNMGINFSCTI